MNEYQESILVGIHTMLEEMIELLKGPPDDATCGTCLWFREDGRKDMIDGSCLKSNRQYAGDDPEGNDCWFFPPTDKDSLCRHWRTK